MPTLDWLGKQAVVNHHREVPTRLRHCDSALSFGDPEAGNQIGEMNDEEEQCALAIELSGKVKRWVRNLKRRPVSFRLATSPDWF